MKKNTQYELEKFIPRAIISYGESMSEKTTFGIGGKVRAYVEPRTKKELIKAVKACEELSLRYKVIGGGSNLLFSSNNLDMVVISTRKMKGKITLHETTVRASAGVMAGELILWCAQHGLSGLEHLFGIPATIGGMAVNNAGAFSHQMSDVVESVMVLDGSVVKILSASELGFSYHHSNLMGSGLVVLAVEMKLERLASSVIYSIIKETISAREKSQPKGKGAGSVFKRCGEVSAGKLIDSANLKGTREGGAEISEKHANFIINRGGATSNDVLKLIDKAEQEVYNKFGVRLEREIEYIGE